MSKRLLKILSTLGIIGTFCGTAHATGLRIVPSTDAVAPGESFFFDVIADDVPSDGLSAFRLKLNISAQGANISSVPDLSQSNPAGISIAAPVLAGPATSTRSGLGNFFLSEVGPNGLLVMENQGFSNGTAVFTFGQTNGYTRNSGSGSIARFTVKAGSSINAQSIDLAIPEAMLFVNGSEYPINAITGAAVEVRCGTSVPNFVGLTQAEAQSLIQSSNLTLGSIYEVNNWNGAYQLGKVISQSISSGAQTLCGSRIDFAINNAPLDITQAQAVDKQNDETGTAVLSWRPSQSSDAAGYRIYLGDTLVKEISDPASTGTELSGLQLSSISQLRIVSFDSFGNMSPGVVLLAIPVDDVAPVISVNGVSDGAFYKTNVLPAISINDAHLAAQTILLNGASYNGATISAEGNYVLNINASDTAGNSTTMSINFAIDMTAPVVSIAGVENGRYYNVDLSPVISITDQNLSAQAITLNGNPYAGSVLSSEGGYELRAEASDRAGNNSSLLYSFIIDKTKPQSSLAFGTFGFQNGGTDYISAGTPITISCQDGGVAPSGIDRIEYRINSGAWSPYTSPFAMSGQPEGAYTLDYHAIDRAGNIENVKTANLVADITSPTTQLTINNPVFQGADGKMYAGLASSISLSAADASSGIRSVDYKFGNGAWATYSVPFTLSTEGENEIHYRSTDNVGNVESEQIKSVFLDLTPPTTEIAFSGPEYKSGQTEYISSSTTINLQASDNLSGVALTEYKLGNGAYAPFVPFSLDTEGPRQITFRSKDNIGNQETATALTLVVDNTPPVTQMSIGEPNFTRDNQVHANTSTQFTLSAADALSGVGRTEYRVDGGSWVPYAPFTLSEGTHDVDYRSSDRLGNLEALNTVRVYVENLLSVSKSVPDYSRVLVWLNACVYQDNGTGNCIDQQLIQNSLSDSGVGYHIVKSKADFQAEVRSNYYTDYLILGDRETLDDQQAMELRERINSGAGLVASLINSSKLYESFGIGSVSALVDTDLSAAFSQSDIYGEGEYQTYGKAINISTTDGEVLATLSTNSYPAVIRKSYGRGKAIFLAFDFGYTIRSGNYSQSSGILGASLNYIHRPADNPQVYMPYDLIPIRIGLNNSGNVFDLKLTETYPSYITLMDGATEEWIDGTSWSTTTHINANESKSVRLFALTPDLLGTFTLTTEVDYSDGGVWKHYTDSTIDLTLTKTGGSLVGDIINALDGLDVSGQEQASRDSARQSIAAVRDRTVFGTTEMDQNIHDITDAVEKVKTILGADTSAIRLNMDALLKLWEEKRYLEN